VTAQLVCPVSDMARINKTLHVTRRCLVVLRDDFELRIRRIAANQFVLIRSILIVSVLRKACKRSPVQNFFRVHAR